MELIVDSGNSRTKFCIAINGDLSEITYVPNIEFLSFLNSNQELKKAENILISATSSQEFAEAIKSHFSKDSQVFMLGQNTKVPISINYILKNGDTFLGGAITPGLKMRFKSMNDYSARLPRIEKLTSFDFPGSSTQESLEAGVFYGILGEIHQFIEETKQSFGQLNVLLTGGDIPYFEKTIKYPTFANPKITLLGLYEILQHSK